MQKTSHFYSLLLLCMRTENIRAQRNERGVLFSSMELPEEEGFKQYFEKLTGLLDALETDAEAEKADVHLRKRHNQVVAEADRHIKTIRGLRNELDRVHLSKNEVQHELTARKRTCNQLENQISAMKKEVTLKEECLMKSKERERKLEETVQKLRTGISSVADHYGMKYNPTSQYSHIVCRESKEKTQTR